MMKKTIKILVALVMVLALTVACTANPGTTTQPAATDADTQRTARVALIVNQKFGDMGPCDQMLAGLEKARDDFGVEIKALESDGVAAHEDDVRAMAKEGYDLIITTFPNMTRQP